MESSSTTTTSTDQEAVLDLASQLDHIARLDLAQLKIYLGNEDPRSLLRHLEKQQQQQQPALVESASSIAQSNNGRRDLSTRKRQRPQKFHFSTKRKIALFTRNSSTNSRLFKSPKKRAISDNNNSVHEEDLLFEDRLTSSASPSTTLAAESDKYEPGEEEEEEGEEEAATPSTQTVAAASNSVASSALHECVIQGKRLRISKSDVQKYTRGGKWRCSEFFRFKTSEMTNLCAFCGIKCKTSIDEVAVCTGCRHFAYKALVKHHMFVCKNNNNNASKTSEGEPCQYKRLRDNTMSSDDVYCRFCHFRAIVTSLPGLARLHSHLVVFVKDRVLFVNSVSKKTMMWKSRLMSVAESSKSSEKQRSPAVTLNSKPKGEPSNANAIKTPSKNERLTTARNASSRNLLETRTSSSSSSRNSVMMSTTVETATSTQQTSVAFTSQTSQKSWDTSERRKLSSNELIKREPPSVNTHNSSGANFNSMSSLGAVDKENDFFNDYYESEFNHQEDHLMQRDPSVINT
jgi:hypothetical protein